MSVSVHPSDPIVMSRTESLWIMPPKKEGCWCLIHYTSKLQKINNLPPSIHILFSHTLWISAKTVSLAWGFVLCQNVTVPQLRVQRSSVPLCIPRVQQLILSWGFLELSVVVLQMTNTGSLASLLLTMLGAGASVPKYVQRATPVCL